MSILKNILSVLAEDAAGEMSVAKVTERALRRVAALETIAKSLQEAQDLDSMLPVRTKRRSAPVDVFGRLLAQPKPGIWKMIYEGRTYLRSFD